MSWDLAQGRWRWRPEVLCSISCGRKVVWISVSSKWLLFLWTRCSVVEDAGSRISGFATIAIFSDVIVQVKCWHWKYLLELWFQHFLHKKVWSWFWYILATNAQIVHCRQLLGYQRWTELLCLVNHIPCSLEYQSGSRIICSLRADLWRLGSQSLRYCTTRVLVLLIGTLRPSRLRTEANKQFPSPTTEKERNCRAGTLGPIQHRRKVPTMRLVTLAEYVAEDWPADAELLLGSCWVLSVFF